MSFKVGRLEIQDKWVQDNRWYVLTLCECGTKKAMREDYINKAIKDKMEISCGCLQKEKVQQTGFKNKKYDYNRAKMQSAYKNMLDRCYNPERPEYCNYGGRGIVVCNSWLKDKEQFIMDVGIPVKDSYQLDRVDNNGNYEPGNVRWVSVTENVRNRRNTIKLTVDGETKSLAEWCQISGNPYHTVKKRIYSGWSHKAAIFNEISPVNVKKEENYL